ASLHSPDVEAAVSVYDLSRGVIQQTTASRQHSVCDILRLSKFPNWQDAVINELGIFLVDALRHICGDDAGANLKYPDSLIRQAVGKQCGDHGNPRLRDAIFRPVRRGGI